MDRRHLGDSSEAERGFRENSERHSGVNPRPSERSDAGSSIRAGRARVRQGKIVRSEAEVEHRKRERYRGASLGAGPCPRPRAREARRALARRTTLLAHKADKHVLPLLAEWTSAMSRMA